MPVVPCVVTPIVTGIVQFSAAEFLQIYPEFTGINTATPAALTNNFTFATLLVNNTCGSRVRDANQRLSLLYLLVAHLTAISNGTNDGNGNIIPPIGVVGRVSDATQGAVTVSVAWESVPHVGEAFYLQTRYGAAYWAMTRQYRTLVYVTPDDPYTPPYSFLDGPIQGIQDGGGGVGGPF